MTFVCTEKWHAKSCASKRLYGTTQDSDINIFTEVYENICHVQRAAMHCIKVEQVISTMRESLHIIKVEQVKASVSMSICACVCIHEHLHLWSPNCWPCNCFDIVSLEYPCWQSPVTWLPGNRNGVPPSFTFKAKCTSIPTVAAHVIQGRGGGRCNRNKEKRHQVESKSKTREEKWRFVENIGCWTYRFT